MKKTDFQALVAADELEAAAAALLETAQKNADAPLHSEALIQAGRLESLKKTRIRGLASEAEQTLGRNEVRAALVELLDQLPETPAAAAAQTRPRGMAESRFKLLVFGVMALGNALAFTCLFVLGEGSGGFSPPEAATTAAMLVSVFAAYFSVMLGEFIARRNETAAAVEARVGERFLWISTGVLAVYFTGVCGLVLRRPMMEFQTFINWLAMLESGLGLFVGQVVHSLFKK